MNHLNTFKKQIHKCSRCGLCQAVCPIYKITGNECSVSRGLFILLEGILKGDLKLNKNINKYLDLCLKCGACTDFCPSGIDATDIILGAKAEYFKTSRKEQIISFFQKNILFKLIPDFINFFSPKIKSKSFDKKVLFFGGCGSKLFGNTNIIKILNQLNIEVITPNFDCCGISLLTRGDMDGVESAITNFIKILKKYDIYEIVTNCASCEKTLIDYIKWTKNEENKKHLKQLRIKNIFSYIKENDLKIRIKNPQKITYHKPCNIKNFDEIEWVLKNTENLEYIEMNEFNECCGLNGILKIKEHNIISKILDKKHKNIKNTSAKFVLTSCLGCQIALSIGAKNSYKVDDLINFLGKNI